MKALRVQNVYRGQAQVCRYRRYRVVIRNLGPLCSAQCRRQCATAAGRINNGFLSVWALSPASLLIAFKRSPRRKGSADESVKRMRVEKAATYW
jgi:hypothetical protein